MTTDLSCHGEDRVEIDCVLCEVRDEAEEIVLVVETACIFCEVHTEAEEIVDHRISNTI